MYENGKKVIYLKVLLVIYRMLMSVLLWYQMICEDLEKNGFVFNNYNPCTANKEIKGSQMTVRFHADDCLNSHKLKFVNNNFLQ